MTTMSSHGGLHGRSKLRQQFTDLKIVPFALGHINLKYELDCTYFYGRYNIFLWDPLKYYTIRLVAGFSDVLDLDDLVDSDDAAFLFFFSTISEYGFVRAASHIDEDVDEDEDEDEVEEDADVFARSGTSDSNVYVVRKGEDVDEDDGAGGGLGS